MIRAAAAGASAGRLMRRPDPSRSAGRWVDRPRRSAPASARGVAGSSAPATATTGDRNRGQPAGQVEAGQSPAHRGVAEPVGGLQRGEQPGRDLRVGVDEPRGEPALRPSRSPASGCRPWRPGRRDPATSAGSPNRAAVQISAAPSTPVGRVDEQLLADRPADRDTGVSRTVHRRRRGPTCATATLSRTASARSAMVSPSSSAGDAGSGAVPCPGRSQPHTSTCVGHQRHDIAPQRGDRGAERRPRTSSGRSAAADRERHGAEPGKAVTATARRRVR